MCELERERGIGKDGMIMLGGLTWSWLFPDVVRWRVDKKIFGTLLEIA